MVLLTVYWLKYRAVLKFRFALKDHQPFNGFIGILSNTVFISAFIFIFLNSDFNIVKTTLFYGSKIFLPVNYEYSLMCWYPNCGVVWNHFQPPKCVSQKKPLGFMCTHEKEKVPVKNSWVNLYRPKKKLFQSDTCAWVRANFYSNSSAYLCIKIIGVYTIQNELSCAVYGFNSLKICVTFI